MQDVCSAREVIQRVNPCLEEFLVVFCIMFWSPGKILEFHHYNIQHQETSPFVMKSLESARSIAMRFSKNCTHSIVSTLKLTIMRRGWGNWWRSSQCLMSEFNYKILYYQLKYITWTTIFSDQWTWRNISRFSTSLVFFPQTISLICSRNRNNSTW